MNVTIDYSWWTVVKIILGSVAGALVFYAAYLGVAAVWSGLASLVGLVRAGKSYCLKCADTREQRLACIYAKEPFKCGKCGTGVKVKMVERKETK